MRNSYMRQNVNKASAMNMHISISMRITTAVPRNMTQVRSIIAIAILSETEAFDITHLSISQTITNAGRIEKRVNANTL